MLVCAAVASAAYVMSPPRLRRRHFRVPFSPTCDVIDDIAAAAISDEEKEMINAVAGPRAAGYGEMLPQGMRALMAATRLRSNDTFVDVGSGSGKLVLQAAADAGVARSVGLELSPTRHAMAQRALDERSAQGAAFAPNVAFILGDALENPQALEVTPLLRTSPLSSPHTSARLTSSFILTSYLATSHRPSAQPPSSSAIICCWEMPFRQSLRSNSPPRRLSEPSSLSNPLPTQGCQGLLLSAKPRSRARCHGRLAASSRASPLPKKLPSMSHLLLSSNFAAL